MPAVAFILLAVVLLLMLGIACACITDHPTQIDRAAGAISAAPAVIEIWSAMTLLLFVSFSVVRPLRLANRSSPSALQRFLL
jgi:hypothetical protein